METQELQEQMQRCEAILQKITGMIHDQDALEAYDRKIGRPYRAIEFSRASTYRKIAQFITNRESPRGD